MLFNLFVCEMHVIVATNTVKPLFRGHLSSGDTSLQDPNWGK